MPNASENHGETRVIGSTNDFVILDGTTGLDNSGCARLRCLQQAVSEWEESIGRHYRTVHEWQRLPRGFCRIFTFSHSNASSIDA
jgi:hypothetical protein